MDERALNANQEDILRKRFITARFFREYQEQPVIHGTGELSLHAVDRIVRCRT